METEQHIEVTGAGLVRMASNDPSELSVFETKVLVIVAVKKPTILQLVNEIRSNESLLYTPFVDPKHVARAVSKLVRKGLLSYKLNPPVVAPDRRSKKRGKR